MEEGAGSLLLESPTAGLSLIALHQPSHERREVVDDGAGVRLAATGELLQCVLPGLGSSLLQHGGEPRAGFLAAVNGALVQRTLVAGDLAKRPVSAPAAPAAWHPLEEESREIERNEPTP